MRHATARQTCIPIVEVLLGLVLSALALPGWFAYGAAPSHVERIPTIPEQSVVLALGFWHLGEDTEGRIIPGDANRYLADWLERHADSIRVVLTQKAIADALSNPTRLSNGTPVLQMHKHHAASPVRTLEALQLALERLTKRPPHLVLLAHHLHVARARADLQVLAPDAAIIVPDTGMVPYWDAHYLNPMLWACYELYLARPADGVRRRWPLHAPLEAVRLPKIDLDDLAAASRKADRPSGYGRPTQ